MENDSFIQPPCFSVNHQRGGGGSSSPQQGPHPPQRDEKAQLCRRKLTVTGFDPLPCKETAKKNNKAVAPWQQSEQHPGPFDQDRGGFHLPSPTQVSALKASHPRRRGCYSFYCQCMVQLSVTVKGAIGTITLCKHKHVRFVR